jgi:membrane fusion protein, adhesin transport system
MFFWKNKIKPVEPVDVLPTEQDIDFVEESKRALVEESSELSRVLLYGIGLFMLFMIIWAKFAVLDEITTASGKVIPSSQVQVIQNLEGGILSQVMVAEGDSVKKDQVLLRIDDTRFASNYREQYAKYLSLIAAVARLKAESSGRGAINFPNEVKEYSPDLITRETALYNSRVEQLESNIATLQESYDLAKKELDITSPLVKEGLMSQLELLRLEREVNELKGNISSEIDKFRATAHQELTEKETELAPLNELLSAVKDRVVRTVVRSPVNGTVKKINIATIGGVIQPGMNIMEIVPAEDRLLVEAKVKPADIAFLYPKQKAIIKFTAYDFSKYGGLDGEVAYISADTIQEETKNGVAEFYKILVRTNKSYLGTESDPLYIIPGMVVTVDILTGKKTVLQYLITPFLRAKQHALTER